MPSTYSNLKIQLMATGENNTTWGDVTNVNLGTALEEAIVGSADVTFASGNVTLTLTNTNTTQTARNMRLRCTGTTGGARDLIVPAIEKPYIVQNDCADAITVKNSTGTGIAVPAGKTMWVYNNGTNVVDAVTHLSSLTLGSALPIASGGTGSTSTTYCNLQSNVTGTLPVANGGTGSTSTTYCNLQSNVTGTLPIANGGTGATSAATARTSLGATTVGGNLFTLTNPSAITFPRFNADNTVSALDAATFRTAIGAGTSSTTGTVTSVGGTGTVSGLTLTGTVTTSGNLTLGGTLSVTPSNFASQTANTFLAAPNGAAGVPTFRTIVAADIPTLNQNTTGTAGNVTGIVAIANGGTGANTAATARTNLGVAASGAVTGTGITMSTARILGRTTAATGAIEEITIGSGLSLSAGALTATGSGGTVTSVGGTGTVNGITLTGTVTSSGNLTLGGTLSGVSLTTQVTGTLPVANGGTGATTLTGVVIGNGTSAFTVKTNPSGAFVGDSDTQNLTNKTLTTGNTLDAGTSISDTGTIAATSPGFRGLPQSSNTTLALTDAGKHIYTTSNVTIPANSGTAFPVGTTVVIANSGSSTLTISITTDTLRQAGTTNTGTRTLAAYGLATCVKVASTTWFITGNIT